MLTDYHVHLRPDEPDTPPASYFTAGNAERYRAAAEEHGIAGAGVAEHVYRFRPRWRSGSTRSGASGPRTTSTTTAAFVREETDLRLGIEADFVPGREDRMANLLEGRDWDYVVGSVHFLRDASLDTEDYSIWGTRRVGRADLAALLRDRRGVGALRPLRHRRPPRPREGLGRQGAAARQGPALLLRARRGGVRGGRRRGRVWHRRAAQAGRRASTRRGRTWR